MILVTGGTGLVGSHLLYSLVKTGKKVRALKRQKSDINNTLHVFGYYDENPKALFESIEWRDSDFTDVLDLQEAFEGVEEVYHCAAMVSFLPKDARRMIRYNPLITANLVNAALSQKVKKFCHVSSVASLSKRENEVTDESDIWKTDPNNSAYGISKYHSEMEVWRGIEEGLNAVIVNPSLILGPGNWEVTSSTLFDRAYKGMPFYSDGTNGFVDVRDLVEIMKELMNREIFGERFVCCAENWKLREFFSQVSNEFGVRPPYLKPSSWMIEGIWKFEWLRSLLSGSRPFITRDSANSAKRKISYSSEKLIKTIDFQFRPVKESIKTYCQFYLDDLETAEA